MLQKLFEIGNMSIDNISQELNNPSVNLWMNRFNTWYNEIDRVPQNEKASFVKIESDIMKTISDRLKDRNIQNDNEIEEQEK